MLHDADIREPLFDFLEETYGKIRIIEEKVIGKSRADVVMVAPEALYGLEIKSDADTYARLAGQVKDYDRYYDYNYAVVGTSHALHIREHIPDYWGIITVEETAEEAPGENLDFYIYRRPEKNPKVDLKHKLASLWRPELARIQQSFDMPKYKEKSRSFVSGRIAERTGFPEGKKGRIDREELDRLISDILFERDYNEVGELLAEYRKGELQKQLEAESDPQKKLELMVEQAGKSRILSKRGFKKKRNSRRRRAGSKA